MASTGRAVVPLPWFLLFFFILSIGCLESARAACELSYVDRGKMYNYGLAAPIPMFPHGVLSEDGFYKVTDDYTTLWFQLCDEMIFNHDPPRCMKCSDCGGTSRCGMGCSALVLEDETGYPVCSAIGHSSNSSISITDEMNPHRGVTVRISNSSQTCSLYVSVICDWNRIQEPKSLKKQGECDYVTEIRHPSGCAKVIHLYGRGWGWFWVFLTIIICVLGCYLIAGAAYRYFFLQVRGIEAVPNLEFWTSLLHRGQSLGTIAAQKLRGASEIGRRAYNPIGSS
ncbi:hypothetical protein MLD38_024122 [Melastoma candidum]|uniref:Uncharacterized protein n=1 Tax=Melastoma candidum TaxID=119954 RepID=A0ACB9NSC3_9MYRT|nr:hypothetical protein MLD38_024122 [Melastoma candidum]